MGGRVISADNDGFSPGDNRPIGIFDSGLGGLCAVNATKALLPGENIIYVGDTARVPYGGKSAATLLGYAKEIIGFLREQNVKAIIAACGTISSNIMEELWSSFTLPIIDVVRPAADFCLEQNYKKVGVIATEGTIKSGMFQSLLAQKFEVLAKPCPLFVPLIENGFADGDISEVVAKNYLADWRVEQLDALVLGCTHYPLLKPALAKALPGAVTIDIAEAAVSRLKNFLNDNKMLSNAKNGVTEVFVSGDTEIFSKMYSKITNAVIAVKSF